jgi:hypothetical protein
VARERRLVRVAAFHLGVAPWVAALHARMAANTHRMSDRQSLVVWTSVRRTLNLFLNQLSLVGTGPPVPARKGFSVCLVAGSIGMGWDHPDFEDEDIGWSGFWCLFGSNR